MKSNFNSIDYHERIRDLELKHARIKIPRDNAEIAVSQHARKFCQNRSYYYEENPLLLEIKNEIEKIGTNNLHMILKYVLGESYEQRDKTLFENRFFFKGYDKNHNRINQDKHKIILISAIYCCRTAKIPMPEFIPIKRTGSFWQNWHINWHNAQEEARARIPPLTHREVFFICLATCEKILTTNEE